MNKESILPWNDVLSYLKWIFLKNVNVLNRFYTSLKPITNDDVIWLQPVLFSFVRTSRILNILIFKIGWNHVRSLFISQVCGAHCALLLIPSILSRITYTAFCADYTHYTANTQHWERYAYRPQHRVSLSYAFAKVYCAA